MSLVLTDAEIELARLSILSPNFSHSRIGSGCWRDIVWIYHFDPYSPSGFKLNFGGPANQLEPILRERKGASPLSPTECR
jgi:hypothetical protein